MVPWIVNFVLLSINLSHFYILSNTDVASIRKNSTSDFWRFCGRGNFAGLKHEFLQNRFYNLLVFIDKMIYPSCIFCYIGINPRWSLVTTTDSPAGYTCQSPNSWWYTYQWSTWITLNGLFMKLLLILTHIIWVMWAI